MAMYTRCPACRSEISFEPPADMASLPEDYRYRIKCPSCGVYIGVRLNRVERQPIYNQEESLALESIGETTQQEYVETAPERAYSSSTKKTGLGRNIFMMIISLIIIALNVVAYLITTEKIKMGNTYGLDVFSGIGYWELLVKDMTAFKATFELDILSGILSLVPMIIFTMSCITFVVALIMAICKKYSRAFNAIWAILLFVLGIVTLFSGLIVYNRTAEKLNEMFDSMPEVEIPRYEKMGIVEYYKNVIESQLYAFFAPFVLTLIQFIGAMICCRSMEKRRRS